MTVRAAMGASRGRLVCEHLKESLLLCALGCAAGIGVTAAKASLDSLTAVAPVKSAVHRSFVARVCGGTTPGC